MATVTVSLIGFIGVLAKFSYIFFVNDRANGEEYHISGYKYLSHFLWAFGNEVFAFCLGIVLWTSTSLHFTNSKAKMPFRWIGYFTMATATYFSVWIFYDGNKFTKEVQFVMAAIFSLVAGGIYVLLLKLLTREIRNFTEIKDRFIDLLYELRNVRFKEVLRTAMKKDLYDEVYQEELKRKSKEFQKPLDEEAKRLIEQD